MQIQYKITPIVYLKSHIFNKTNTANRRCLSWEGTKFFVYEHKKCLKWVIKNVLKFQALIFDLEFVCGTVSGPNKAFDQYIFLNYVI